LGLAPELVLKKGSVPVFGAVALIVYATVLLFANSSVAGGSDSSGYLNEARLFARGKVAERVRALAVIGPPPGGRLDAYIPLGYRSGRNPGTMAPSYPPGLSLHMALLGIIGGWSFAPFLAAPIAAIAALLLLYAVERELGLSRGSAAAGALVLALCPIFFGLAVQPMSDVPATAWVLAAIYFALRARRNETWALAAGAALGIAVLVRPTNVLAAVSLLFALPTRRAVLLRTLIGGLPFLLFLFLYDAFGRASSTGYGAMLTWTMSAANVLPEIRHHAYWLAALLTPLVPLAWLAVGFDRRIPSRDRWLLVTWFGAFLAFYCFYEVYTDWWVVRFLLPGMPAMILAALLVARDVRLTAIPKRVLGVAALVLIGAVGIFHARRFHLLTMERGERAYRDASRGAARLAPPRSVIAAMQMSGALTYYTDRAILRWDRTTPEGFAELRRRARGRDMSFWALLWPFEVAEFAARLPGDWAPVGRWGEVILYRLR
jgi:4-amino-4-deoxy-L-arabinose transferase-like glycosyltransferase